MDPATVISLTANALFAVWVFYNSKYWPAQQQQRELDQAFNQKTRGEAFTQVLEINKALVDNLIERSKLEERITAIDTKIDELRSDLARVISRSADDRERVEVVGAKIEKAGVEK